METERNLYFDPFADNGAELFDPSELFEQIKSNYEQGNVKHDYSADNFVKDTESLLMDAVFLERFDAVQAIAAEMHRMCGEDHNLRTAMQENGYFGHENEHVLHNHDHSHDEEDDKTKKKKKRKVKAKSRKEIMGFWVLLSSSS
jgi:hypothetical protein